MNSANERGLYEREEQLGTLGTLIEATAAGEAGVGLIEGAAGIGKSRLLTEARRLGGRVVVINADRPIEAIQQEVLARAKTELATKC